MYQRLHRIQLYYNMTHDWTTIMNMYMPPTMSTYMPPTMNMYMNPVRRMVFAPAALQEIPQKRDFSFDVGESKNGKLLCVLLNEHQQT